MRASASFGRPATRAAALVAALLAGLVACARTPAERPAPAAAQPGGGPMAITIVETTQGEIAGFQIGVGNAWEDEYTTADGRTEKGPTAILSVSDESGNRVLRARVHPGQVVEFGGRQWRVEAVSAPDDAHGSVTLAEQEGGR